MRTSTNRERILISSYQFVASGAFHDVLHTAYKIGFHFKYHQYPLENHFDLGKEEARKKHALGHLLDSSCAVPDSSLKPMSCKFTAHEAVT